MNSIKKNYIYNTLLQILLLIVPIITTPYLTRVIGAEGLGVYSYYFSIASYFVIFIKLGIDNYGNRTIAEHKNNQLELNTSFSELIYLQFFLGGIIVTIYIVYAFCFSSDRKYVLLFLVLVLSSCFDITWYLSGMEEFKSISIRNAVIKLLNTTLIFLLIKEENDVFKYCLILILGSLVSQIIAWPLVLKTTKLVKVHIKGIIKHLKPNLLLFLTVISVSIFKIMDKIMLGLMTSGKMEVGFYESSERIIHIPSILVVSLGTVMMPRISNMIALHDNSYKKIFFTSIMFSMAISSSITFGIMGISKEFVPFFYGAGFERNELLFLILLPCCPFMAFANVIRTQYLLPNHRDKDFLISGILAASVNLIANFIMIPMWGSVGAAIATLLAEIIGCIYQAFVVAKELDIKKYIKYSIWFVFLGIIMFICIYFMHFTFCQSLILQIVTKIIMGTLIYVMGSIIIIYILSKESDEEVYFFIYSIKSLFIRFRLKS